MLHRETVSVCLDLISLIPGLFNGPGSSSESYSFFNAEGNLVVCHTLEIPLPMSCGEMRFLALTLWSSTSRTGARRDGIAVSEKWLDVMVCFFVNSAKDFQSPTIQSR